MTAAKDLRKEALGLSPVDRARLARELLESLDDSADADAEQAWLEEVEHRSASVDDGTAELEDWAAVRDRISMRLRALRP